MSSFMLMEFALIYATLGFLASFFLVALLVMLREPDVSSYGEAIWYTFVSCTTIGYGDLVARTTFGRALIIYITMYEIIWIAVLSGVIISHYMEVISRREKLTATKFMDRMEHLPELSKEELQELSDKVREFKEKL
jgi:voltage-gated potassium channel